jgi:hypothetical protein
MVKFDWSRLTIKENNPVPKQKIILDFRVK